MSNPWLLLTGRGRILLVIGLALSFLAAMLGQRDIFVLGVLLLITPLVAALATRLTRLRLTCQRNVEPHQIPIGDQLTSTLTLTRDGRIPSGLLSFEDAVPAALGSRPRFTARGLGHEAPLVAQYTLTGRARGRFQVGPLLVRTSDPFGLAQIDRQFRATSEVLVTPRIVPLAPMSNAGGGGATGESRPHRIGVSGQEDILVREYRDGDDVRRVHWRSTARRGELMVRREEQAWDPDVAVILDNRSLAHTGQGMAGSFECAVSAAASVALHFLGHKYSVNLLDARGPVTGSDSDLESRVAAREHLIHALTDIQTTNTEDDFSTVAQVAGSNQSGQLLVAVTGRLTMADAHHLLFCQRNRSGAMALVLDVDSWVMRSERASAEERAAHEDAVNLLRQSMWRVVEINRNDDIADSWQQLAHLGVGQ